jgi:hypothetical protein
MEGLMRRIHDDTPLAFACSLTDGRVVATVGEAASFLAALPDKDREKPHWQTAVRMFNHAINEPEYLPTATLSFRSALMLEGLAEPEFG